MRRIVLLGAILALLSACAPRIQDPGPHALDPMTPRLTGTAYVTRDGTELPLQRWTPDTTPRGVLLALHGFNDYSNAFAEFGPWMARHGITTIAYDQRGFGTSQQKGLWPGYDVLAADAEGALVAIAKAYPGLPVYALGESMGGAVLLAANDRTPLTADGLILVAPAVWGRATIPAYQTATLWVFAHTLPWLTLSGQGIKRNPSDNIEMLRALGRDPLVIKNTRVDSLWGIVNLMDAAQAAAARLETPALLLFGANDDIIPPEAARRMLDTLPETPARERQIAVYKNGYHMLLRDLQAATVWADVLAWMDSPGTPLPSGADRGDPLAKLPGR
jgi:acylglycerol lipase